MRKGILLGVGVLIVISALLYLSYKLLTNDNDHTYVLDDYINEPIEKIDRERVITDFNYNIEETDEVKIWLYEYKKDGVNYIFASKTQIENVSDDITNEINSFLSNINGKNAVDGIFYGPTYSVKIEVINEDYEMEIMLGYYEDTDKGFITIEICDSTSQKQFTIRQGLTEDIKDLITNIKN